MEHIKDNIQVCQSEAGGQTVKYILQVANLLHTILIKSLSHLT